MLLNVFDCHRNYNNNYVQYSTVSHNNFVYDTNLNHEKIFKKPY